MLPNGLTQCSLTTTSSESMTDSAKRPRLVSSASSWFTLPIGYAADNRSNTPLSSFASPHPHCPINDTWCQIVSNPNLGDARIRPSRLPAG
jgi:hypothetical protein